MIQLFPELRTQLMKDHCEIIAHRALRICEMVRLGQTHGQRAMKATQVQAGLVAVGEEWAKDRSGYMSIWGILKNLAEAGVLVKGPQGFEFAGEGKLLQVYSAALDEVVRQAIPDLPSLREWKQSLLDLNFTARLRTQVISPETERVSSELA